MGKRYKTCEHCGDYSIENNEYTLHELTCEKNDNAITMEEAKTKLLKGRNKRPRTSARLAAQQRQQENPNNDDFDSIEYDNGEEDGVYVDYLVVSHFSRTRDQRKMKNIRFSISDKLVPEKNSNLKEKVF
ncbi:hypothetical protein BDA99DRAFT_78515 [Phascolomyces articulosus]|uniref:Uncharacterized protein n=1 Tax=Phascolomyces articulosus TaxID=60185 RepID=A0AAD5K8M9_9FUNG|nr:hypothetical protein BDA99DRAFT_78515 [Phascolomyces articulosus]